MESTSLQCKQCNWQGSPEEVDWDDVETCSGSDKVEVCPSCGSMEVYPVR
jgi:NAD-dependent SIR2 family protein deacetylase